MAQFFVGTAGWSYLKWDKEFYPKGVKSIDKLAFYASRFNAVELNNTFYRLPVPEQFPKWEAETPASFRFAAKASRYITHVKRLKDVDKILPDFFSALSLQKKAGPILFQLPPTFALNMERLDVFLTLLPKDRRCAVELRDPSWHNDAVYKLLKKHKVAFCLFDTPEGISPRVSTADFAYVRLRGRKDKKLDAFFGEWKKWLSDHAKNAYVFFDNREEKRLAFGNALIFREMTKEKSK